MIMYFGISMSIYSLFFVILVSNFLIAMVIVFKEKRDIGSTWAWLMVLFFLPIFGFIIYLFVGRRLKTYTSSQNERYLLPPPEDQLNLIKSNQLLQKYSNLLLMNLKSSRALITSHNEIEILNSGYEKFNTFFNDIRASRTEINIQYYILKQDSLGIKLRDELIRKAKEGVKVRVLYDAIGSRGISRFFFNELISYGGEVAVFSPSFLKIVNLRVNNRNHRKLCIIDGHIAYIGGFNVGNEYLGLNKKFGYWRDTHIRVTGESVKEFQASFISDWNKARNKKNVELKEFSFPIEKQTGTSAIQVITGGPNSETENLKYLFVMLIQSAKRSVYIQTPYFIPDTSLMDAYKISLLAGVDIRIMVPNKSSNPFAYWATMSYVGELLPYGAKILMYQRGFLHGKTIVVDEEVASVGTTNMDIRSFKLNFEINALIYDRTIASQLQKSFIEDSQDSSEITLKKYKERSITIKCKEGLSRLFSPIL
jgi:cardiolipin synthase